MVTVRRPVMRAALVGAGVAGAALVVGCGGAGSAAGSAAQSPTSTSQSPAGSGTGKQVSASTGGGVVGRCHTADLTATLGGKKKLAVNVQGQLGAAGTHYTISLIWTNHGKTSCTMRGFAGVDMDGPNLGDTGGPTYSLPRSGGSPATVTLAPGGNAHTVIQYIDPSGVNPDNPPLWTPTHLDATPPDETTQVSVPWTAGTPVYFDPQDGIAAASVSPVTPGT